MKYQYQCACGIPFADREGFMEHFRSCQEARDFVAEARKLSEEFEIAQRSYDDMEGMV